jgi:tRNA-dihydrouridine synthase B
MKIGKIDIDKPVALAPMEGITDLPFRLICKKMGADLVYTEFIRSDKLVGENEKAWRKMEVLDAERPVCVQIYGNKNEFLKEAAQIVEDQGADWVDINFGCWVSKVVGHYAGAAFLKDPQMLADCAQEVAQAVNIPVTIKTRLGWSPEDISILEVADLLDKTDIAAMAVHCRTRDMGMRGHADWSWIPKIKEHFSRGVILNGDIRSAEDAARAYESTDCDGIMIGRGAVGNPFLFREVKDLLTSGKVRQIDYSTRIDTCLEHFHFSLEYNIKKFGFYAFRKHYGGYLTGLTNGREVRNKLVRVETIDEVEKLLKEFKEFLAGVDDPYDTENSTEREKEFKCLSEKEGI